MNPPDPSGPDGSFPRLAGYADGELDSETRRQIAGWVESDPEAAELLHDQQQFAPSNAEFWAAVAPPQPGEAAWEAVRRAVADRLTPAAVSPRRPAIRTGYSLPASAAGVALTVLAGWLLLDRSGPLPADGTKSLPPAAEQLATRLPDAGDPLSEFAVLELASPDDVLIEAVSGRPPAAGFCADSPEFDPMPLAAVGDVVVLDVRPGPGGERPDCELCPKPGDAPMIYAAEPRRR
jgi:hypothetical protein